MASIIRVLSDQAINQIAAGEVIENPASVVKELVENSLDAGATEIHVEIQGGGRQLIRVTDNGRGMTPDDALLCLERHATSKIKQVDDLLSLTTMGFRGEALPSIASISKFTLITAHQTAEEKGTLVFVEGGKILKCCPAARSAGTTIEVKSLFFNVPVRKKFQRSPSYDSQEILKMLTSISLGYPQIAFQLVSSQKVIFNTLKPQRTIFLEQLHERIAFSLGKEFLVGTCPLDNRREADQIAGYIGLPAYTRHNRTGQFLFINQRHVQSPLVSFAVKDGYGPALASNRYPVFVLHLTLPGSIVDVNVHPQKREVRLRQEQNLRELVTKAVEASLQRAGYSQQAEIAERPLFVPAPYAYVPPLSKKSEPSFLPHPATSTPPMPNWNIHSNAPQAGMETISFLDALPLPQPTQVAVIPILSTLPGYVIMDLAHLPNVARTGLAVIDQRAAHSRIIYEKLLAARQKQEDQAQPIQPLLIPYTFDVNPMEAGLLREHLPTLQHLGIGIKEFGLHTFMLDSIPDFFGNTAVEVFMRDLLAHLQDSNLQDLYKGEVERQLAVVASQAAISKTKRLSKEEGQQLIAQLLECKTPYLCPQGRPTVLSWSLDELSKQFLKI